MTDTTDPAYDLNAIMSIDPLDLSKRDLDNIIAYQRKQRMQREAGVKTTRTKEGAPAVDIKELLGRMAKPAAPTLKEALKTSTTPPAKGGFVRRF